MKLSTLVKSVAALSAVAGLVYIVNKLSDDVPYLGEATIVDEAVARDIEVPVQDAPAPDVAE